MCVKSPTDPNMVVSVCVEQLPHTQVATPEFKTYVQLLRRNCVALGEGVRAFPYLFSMGLWL